MEGYRSIAERADGQAVKNAIFGRIAVKSLRVVGIKRAQGLLGDFVRNFRKFGDDARFTDRQWACLREMAFGKHREMRREDPEEARKRMRSWQAARKLDAELWRP